MAAQLVTRINRYIGTAAEIAAMTLTDIPTGSTFFESDTGILKILNAAGALVEAPSESVQLSGSNLGQEPIVPGTVGIRSMPTFDFRPSTNRKMVLAVGAAEEWDAKIREIGNVIYHPWDTTKRYKLVYSGYMGTYAENAVYVGLATSTDGETWTKQGKINTVRASEDPYMIYHDGTYYLFVEDKEIVPFTSIRLYTSTDLTEWTDEGDILAPGATGTWDASDVSSPVVWIENGTWYLLFEGRSPNQAGAIGLATSTDGKVWSKSTSNPVLHGNLPTVFTDEPDIAWALNLASDDIVKVDGIYYFLYHAYPYKSNFVPALAVSTDLVNWADKGIVDLEIPPTTAIEGGTVMLIQDGMYRAIYNFGTGVATRGIYQTGIVGQGGTLAPIKPKSNNSTVQVIYDAVVAAAGNAQSVFIPCEDVRNIGVTFRWSASTTTTLTVFWSNDGTNSHGKETATSSKVGDTADSITIIPVKAKYVRLYFANGGASEATLNAWLHMER